LSTRLERYVWMTIAVVALSVAILAMLPDVAAAQEEDTSGAPPRQVEQNADESTYESTDSAADRRRVVTPGDSLWSIAQEQLGPNAAPEWVANEAGRIHWLNHDRIGEDPNLILVGQELLVSPVVGEEPRATQPRVYEPATAEEGSATTPAAQPAAEQPTWEESAEANNEEPVATPTEEPAEEPAVEGSAEANNEEPEGAGARERRMIGWGILLLTLLIAVLGAWRWLMNRPERRGGGSRYDNYARPRHQEQQQEEEQEQAAETEAAERGAPEPEAEPPPRSRRLPPRPDRDGRTATSER
jgi:hypothetical protein